MSFSSSTGFRFRKSVYGGDQPAGLRFRVANSVTLKFGDAVRIDTSGFLNTVGVGDPVLGICTGFVNNDGINIFSLGANQSGGTLTPDDQVATASDNESRSAADGFIEGEVVVDPSGSILWYNDADGDLAQAQVNALYDVLAGADQIDQSSVEDTSGQFQLVSIDPDGDADLSKGLFRISEPQWITQLGNSTAVNST